MKYCGIIGFAETTEIKPGVWKEIITERQYFGELTNTRRRLESSGGLNDNVIISNELSILSDPYANQNFASIRYAEFMGNKWKISNVTIAYPRLILTFGGLYNA